MIYTQLFFFDTEFIENGKTIDLLSIGIVGQDGSEFYAVNVEADLSKASPWVQENVIPYLDPEGTAKHSTRQELAMDIFYWVSAKPQFWAYFCVAPTTKVLTAKLEWKEAGRVAIGDQLVGFQENAALGQGRSRRWRQWELATVINNESTIRPCFNLIFEDGTQVQCSAEHKWLVRGDARARWVTTENLRCGPKFHSNIVKPLNVWDFDTSRTAGYLAAALDGEGHLSQLDLRQKPRGICRLKLGFAQNQNEMLDTTVAILREKGFPYREHVNESGNHQLTIGNRDDILHLLGAIRPVRLLPKLKINQMGAMRTMKTSKLISKVFIGDAPVVALATDTKTYIAEGLASHNSSYDWVVLCQLYGTMTQLPPLWPQFCMDLKQWHYQLGSPTLPAQDPALEHNALEDARWNKKAWEFLTDYRNNK